MAAIMTALAAAVYLVLGPAQGVKKLMQLTKTSWDFELFLIGLGVLYLLLAWGCEAFVFPGLAWYMGKALQRITQKSKQRKAYKTIQEAMGM